MSLQYSIGGLGLTGLRVTAPGIEVNTPGSGACSTRLNSEASSLNYDLIVHLG